MTFPKLSAMLTIVASLFVPLMAFSQESVQSGGKSPEAVSDEHLEFLRTKVRPLLESRCFECHGPESESKGGLSMATRSAMLSGGDSGPLMEPGKPEGSLLLSAVRYESFEMPPRSRMPDEEIAILEKWIAIGAPWEDSAAGAAPHAEKAEFPLAERRASHWAWHPIQNPPVPDVGDSDWPAGDIDRFLLHRLKQEGLEPADDADRRVLLRRLTFDLTGLPPSEELQQRFLNDPDETPRALEKIVDELLASPQFGERWARHWLDLVRYAETLGHEFDYPLPYAWRYRDYVIRAFNEDVPYNQFVREHVAGDLLGTPRRNRQDLYNESIIGTGFWYLSEDKHAPVDVRGEEAARMDNQIDVFGKTFLGLTIGCTRCHDHKFDAITAADYYALAGFLQSSRRRVEYLDPVRRTESMARLLAFLRKDTREPVSHGILAMPAANVIEQIRTWLKPQEGENASQNLLLKPSTLEPDHPLSLVASMKRARVAAETAAASNSGEAKVYDWKAAVQEWCRFIQEAEESPGMKGSERFARVEGEVPEGWLTYGLAFHWIENSAFSTETERKLGDRNPAYTFDISWTPEGPRILTRDRISSLVMGPEFRGVLATPTFELKHPEIAVLVAGERSRLRLVIDGYVMNEFSELLFSGARQPIDTAGEYRWIRLSGDIQRYLGHRCHLEFLDDGDGWFSVKEVRFLNHVGGVDPPLHAPADVNLKLAKSLADNPPATEDDLLSRLAIAISQDIHYAELIAEMNLMYSGATTALEKAAQAWPEIINGYPENIPVLVMCDGSSEDEHLLIRGNHRNNGPLVPRRFLEALDGPAGMDIPQGSGRLQLADRLVAEDNPLVARVMVNRIWQHMFGAGIVASPDNFGVLGQRPTHPELLDYLATQFREQGWSVKKMVRTMALSHAYRMSSIGKGLAMKKTRATSCSIEQMYGDLRGKHCETASSQCPVGST